MRNKQHCRKGRIVSRDLHLLTPFLVHKNPGENSGRGKEAVLESESDNTGLYTRLISVLDA